MIKMKYLFLIGMFIGATNVLATNSEQEEFKDSRSGKIIGAEVVNSSTVRLRVSLLSDEELLAQPTVEKSFKIFEDDSVVKVLISGAQGDDTRRLISDVIVTARTWKHQDEDLFSWQDVQCKVILGDNIVPLGFYRREQKNPYVELSGVEERENVPLTSWGTVFKYAQYERPDKSICKKRESALYQTKTENVRRFVKKATECTSVTKELCVRGLNTSYKDRHHTVTSNFYNLLSITLMRNMDGSNEQEKESTVIQANIKEFVESGTNAHCVGTKLHK
jgi:hypothetical protein